MVQLQLVINPILLLQHLECRCPHPEKWQAEDIKDCNAAYSSHTLYTRTFTEKRQQHVEMCESLTEVGFDILPLPAGPGVAGTLFKQTTKEMDIPKLRKQNLPSKVHLDSLHILQHRVSQRNNLERQYTSLEIREERRSGPLISHPTLFIGAIR